MLNKFSLTLLVALVPLGTVQAIEFTTPQADKSKLGFTFKQMGVAVDGNFRKFSTKLAFDPAKPEKASATLEIDLASIDAGSDEANDEVKNQAWFNTKAYPTAKFVSSAVKSLGGGRYEVSGTMTIKGRSKPAVAPFTFKQEGNTGVFEGAFVLKRADFAIGEGQWADFGTVANEIQIRFRVVATAATGK